MSEIQMKIRLPKEIKRWLAIEAAKNMRTQSAEVVLALKEKMDRSANSEDGEASAS